MSKELDELRDVVTKLQLDNAKKDGALEERKKLTKWLCTVSISAALAIGSLFYHTGELLVRNFTAVKAAFVTFWDVSERKND